VAIKALKDPRQKDSYALLLCVFENNLMFCADDTAKHGDNVCVHSVICIFLCVLYSVHM